MNKLVPIFLVLACACAAFSQQQTPTPPPADDADVVKITTALIQLDVTVTDKKGNAITDLRPDEIEVFENGEKQDLTRFSFIPGAKTPETKKLKNDEKPFVLPAGGLRPEDVRRSIAIVVDDLSLSFESTYFVQKELRKFVDEQMQDGDLVAIIRTGAGIGALQQFTTDKRQLYAAIDRVRWNPLGSGGIGSFVPLDARGADDEPEGVNGGGEYETFRQSVFGTGTLGAINYVIRGMADLPGRKSVLLVSHGFPMSLRTRAGSAISDQVLYSLRRLVDLANRAAVVVYTLDARGLEFTGLTAADDTSGRSFEDLDNIARSRSDFVFSTQEGLRYLAKQTGGIPILNTNDIGDGIRRVLDDQSYYLVGYEPDDSTFDPTIRRFNKIEVKVKRPGVRVRYRSGFFGVSDEKIARPQQTPEQRLLYALSSPFAVNDVALRLNALFHSTSKDASLIRSLVHVRAQDLKFTEQPDGSRKATFDIFAVGFGDNGIAVDKRAGTYSLTLTKDRYEKAMATGFVYDFTFAVKKPGAYQLRIALRDHASDKLGSANQFVEVPNLKKNRIVLSGVALENLEYAEWQRRNAGQPATEPTDPLTDTSLRSFRRGTVLNYSFRIFNAKFGPGGPDLSFQTRMFRDGQQVYEGKLQPIPAGRRDASSVEFTSAFAIGTAMAPGDYVLQINVIDNLAKAKRNTATQFVQFEIVE